MLLIVPNGEKPNENGKFSLGFLGLYFGPACEYTRGFFIFSLKEYSADTAAMWR